MSTIQNFATITPENFKMSPATLESTALEFDFDTLGLDLLALDGPDDQPGDQGNEAASRCPTITDREFIENGGEVFTTEYLYTLEDDEQSSNMPDWAANALKPVPVPAPTSLESGPLSPLQLPASIPAAIQAALESPALESPEPDCAPGRNASAAPAPCGFLTRRQELTEEINTLESQVVEYSETEYELAEKVSQVRKWRKEALENLRALKWQLNAMSDEDAEKPVETKIKFTGKIDGVEIGSATLTEKQLATAAADIATNLTIDHGGQQSITALGVTPKQLEKFEIEGIRTVSQFERALADRSIENVRGIQERTMDKLRESLWEFRKQHPITDPDDRPVLTASERDAKIEAAGEPATQIEPQIEQPTEEDMGGKYRAAHWAGQVARRTGIDLSDNPIKDAPFLASHWEDGWREEDEAHQEIAKRLSAGAKGEPSKAIEAGETPETKPKATRKPRAKKAKGEASSEATDGTEATTEATKSE